jgi:hypothetical protein
MTPQSRTLPPATAAARIAPLLLALAGLAIAAGGLWLWRHRQQIGAALVAAVATTYAAGTWCQRQVEDLAADSARRLPSQPVPALAPITATIAAAWGLVDRAAMTRADRAQWARLTRQLNADRACCPELRARAPLHPTHCNGGNGPAAMAGRMADIASAYGCSVIEPARFQAVVRVNGRRPNA